MDEAKSNGTPVRLYQWANPTRAHGMADPAELARDGWIVVGADPRYVGTVLMMREEG